MVEDRRWILATFAVIFVAAVAISFVYRSGQATAGGAVLSASGVVESNEAVLSSEVSGRIVALPIREGAQVNAGDIVARLDDSLIQLQIAQATDPAAKRVLEVQAERYVIHSPTVGVLTRLPVHVGEMATPAEPLASVADLNQLQVTVYVLERDLGRVALQQSVNVTADPFPRQSLPGTVISISSSAEFTPRNVQTQRDRENLVYGVKVSVDNSNALLKLGMPVDVSFNPAS